jgi:hypothetical protein
MRQLDAGKNCLTRSAAPRFEAVTSFFTGEQFAALILKRPEIVECVRLSGGLVGSHFGSLTGGSNWRDNV